MTTCRDAIASALRKLGALSKYENPSDQDEAVGMAAITTLFDGWLAGGKFGRLRDRYAAADYTARAGERVRSSAVITLPAYTTDNAGSYGCDDYGFWRGCDDSCPTNLAVIVVVNPVAGTRQVNLWEANVGAWVRLDNLTASDALPLATIGAEDFACCLAKALASEVGAAGELTPLTLQRANLFEQRLTMRADSRRTATRPEFC